MLFGITVGLTIGFNSTAYAFGHDKFKNELKKLISPKTEKPAPQPQKKMIKRSIKNIKGDVFQFKNAGHNSVFMVSGSGIVLVDPINRDAATWLKAKLKERFNQSVKYVIYSHDHADHISGGEVFADTAIFISHVKAKQDIIAEKRPTAVPDITFKDNMTLVLGGKKVELSYVGRNHSDNSIVMNFPAERILHAVDFISVRAVAFRDLPDAHVDEWIDSLKRVEAMDFDILSPGHGRIGVKQDVRAFRGYMESLRSQVTALVRTGDSVDEVVAKVSMDIYRAWFGYDRYVKTNVRAMYERVKLTRRGNPRPRP